LGLINKIKKMKTIIITRHAKSSWDNILQPDFERTLNERGHRDAPIMGERLKNKNIIIDQVISSTAARAKQTAEHIANAINYQATKISFLQDLYHAPPAMINEVIISLDDTINTAMIVCHNPGITHWVNEQVGYLLDNMPTCSMVCFSAACNNWYQFTTSKKELIFIDFPKNQVG
jgi:phosphohistidine phosphatase